MASFGRIIIAAMAAGVLTAGQADAADFRRVPGSPGMAVLEGRIERGDHDKLRAFLRDGPDIHEIYLASPGGLLGESYRMGRLIRHLGLATIIPSEGPARQRERVRLTRPHVNHKCASACFFIFIGGIDRRTEIGGRPKLGIHRPHYPDHDLKKRRIDYATALRRSRELIEGYIADMGVPVTYVEPMFDTPKERMRWITGKEFETDFVGLVRAHKDRLSALCDKRTDSEKEAWSQLKDKARLTDAERSIRSALLKKQDEQVKCEKQAQIEFAQAQLREYRLSIPRSGCPDAKREEEPGVAGRDPRGAGSVRLCF